MAALHGQVLGHLLKRGFESVSAGEPQLPRVSMSMDRDDLMQMQQDSWKEISELFPPWGVTMVFITTAIFYVLILSLAYTIGRVVMTLAMIETPTVDYIPVAALDNLDANSKTNQSLMIDGEPHIVERNKPITGSIRRTVRHLTSIGGWAARWRGLRLAILYALCNGLVFSVIISALFWAPGGQILASIIATVVTAPLHCAWTHKMISMPAKKGLRARIPGRSSWRQLWIPNAVASASSQSSIMLVAMLAVALFRTAISDPENPQEPKRVTDSLIIIILKIVAVLALAFFLTFFVVLPNYAALTRIEAALLPDEEETVVPFDRTFGGKVTPVVVGGSGWNYVKEVCRTFDREARVRIIKLFFKGSAIVIGLAILEMHVILFEWFLIVRPINGKSTFSGKGALSW